MLSLPLGKLAEMDGKSRSEEPVSEFIRFLITRWEGDGKKLYELAAQAGLAKSMPSQLKARTSDASFYSATKLAKPLGYADLPDLVHAAWAWWHSDRTVVPAGAAESPRAEAMRLAAQYGVTQQQIARVLERFPLPQFAHADTLWWLSRFHEERTIEAEQSAALLALGRQATAAAKAGAKKQAELREVVAEKKRGRKAKGPGQRRAG